MPSIARWLGPTLLLPGFLSGCVATNVPEVAPTQARLIPHAVFINNSGEGITLKCSGALQCPESFDKQLDLIADSIRANPNKRILIRIHGGLNTLGSSFETSDVMIDRIQADVTDTSAHVYPLFVNWESGLKSTYAEHLFYITQGQRYHGFSRVVVFPVYFVADIGKGVTRAPFTLGQQVINFFRGISSAGRDPVLIDDDGIQRSEGGYRPSAFERVTFFTRSVVLSPIKAVEVVFVDALGTPAWDNMHRRTKVLFRDPNEFEHDRERKKAECASRVVAAGVASSTQTTGLGSASVQSGGDSVTCPEEAYSPATGALSQLLDRIQAVTTADSTRRVTLIGHSMGAIVATEIVRTRDSIPFDNIVFMAGANSVREFELGVVPYLARHPATQFYNLTLHPKADERELTVLGIGPNGSLLEWLDAYFVNPETDPDRMMGRYSNILDAEHMFAPGIRRQIHIKAFGYKDGNGCGEHGQPYEHGGFNDASVPFWRASFWQPGSQKCAAFDPTTHAWMTR